MNYIKNTLILAFTGLSILSCKENQTKNTETVVEKTTVVMAKPETVSMTIDGMSCPEGCARVIENKLGRMNGVANATVNFETKIATITYDSEVQTVPEMTQLIEGLADGKSYKVSDVKTTSM